MSAEAAGMLHPEDPGYDSNGREARAGARANGKDNAPETSNRSDTGLRPEKLAGIDFAQMGPRLAEGYLVKGLLCPNSLSSIVGKTGCGKTFFATDLALHIASGRPWRGCQVRGGLVVYAALEGPLSAERRFYAARLAREFAPSVPLRLTPGPINLREPAEVSRLVQFVKDAETGHGDKKCVCVFIDTLSRAISGGDENGPEDMGALVKGADDLRIKTGATVILVHHLGKDEARGSRGHTCFKAALDTEIEVQGQEGTRSALVTKQRDLPAGQSFAFTLKSVELGRDEDGDPVTSCVVAPAEAERVVRRDPTGKHQTAMLAALQEHFRTATTDLLSSIEWRSIGKAQGVPRQRFREVEESLVKFGWLRPSVGGWRFLREPE